MNIIKTLVLLGILAVLAAYVYFYEIKGGEEREKEQAAAEKIIDFEPDSVQQIDMRSVLNQFVFEITRKNKATICRVLFHEIA